jgi:hypothetical protein
MIDLRGILSKKSLKNVEENTAKLYKRLFIVFDFIGVCNHMKSHSEKSSDLHTDILTLQSSNYFSFKTIVDCVLYCT